MPQEKSLAEQKAELEVELMREQVEQQKAKNAARAAMMEGQRRTNAENLRLEKRRQDGCNHRKGGIGADAYRTGQGSMNEYAVNNQTTPSGEVYRLCLRCSKEWHPPNCRCNPKKASTQEEYATAMRWPTDNVASSSVTFSIPEVVA